VVSSGQKGNRRRTVLPCVLDVDQKTSTATVISAISWDQSVRQFSREIIDQHKERNDMDIDEPTRPQLPRRGGTRKPSTEQEDQKSFPRSLDVHSHQAMSAITLDQSLIHIVDPLEDKRGVDNDENSRPPIPGRRLIGGHPAVSSITLDQSLIRLLEPEEEKGSDDDEEKHRRILGSQLFHSKRAISAFSLDQSVVRILESTTRKRGVDDDEPPTRPHVPYRRSRNKGDDDEGHPLIIVSNGPGQVSALTMNQSMLFKDAPEPADALAERCLMEELNEDSGATSFALLLSRGEDDWRWNGTDHYENSTGSHPLLIFKNESHHVSALTMNQSVAFRGAPLTTMRLMEKSNQPVGGDTSTTLLLGNQEDCQHKAVSRRNSVLLPIMRRLRQIFCVFRRRRSRSMSHKKRRPYEYSPATVETNAGR